MTLFTKDHSVNLPSILSVPQNHLCESGRPFQQPLLPSPAYTAPLCLLASPAAPLIYGPGFPDFAHKEANSFSFRPVCWMWLIKLQTHDSCVIQTLLIVTANSLSTQNGVDGLMPIKSLLLQNEADCDCRPCVLCDTWWFYVWLWNNFVNDGLRMKKMWMVLEYAKTPALMPGCFGWFPECSYMQFLYSSAWLLTSLWLSYFLQCKSMGFFLHQRKLHKKWIITKLSSTSCTI